MIITTQAPYLPNQVDELREQFDIYIKTVIDVRQEICVAGMDRHFEGEAILLNQGSKQSDIWGGGIDLENKIIDFNSFINIRPNDGNASNEIQSASIRNKYEILTKYFFKVIYEK